MKRRLLICSLFVLVITAGDSLLACLWDYDTLEMERQQFPSALELITGKFQRHSPEYYQWRVDDRLKKLKNDPANLALHDDLAVGYEKLGRHDDAIKTMQRAEKLKPGRYETHANLGTFYIHAGNFEEGLKHIDKAIAINPEAHFGRERYQKLLVEYATLARRDGKIALPMSDQLKGQSFWKGENDMVAWGKTPFPQFILWKRNSIKPREEELKDATKGVLGMMRFGNFESPTLLEALAELLLDGEKSTEGAKRLAARAYLKASYAVKDPAARDKYRKLAKSVIKFQTANSQTENPMTLEELERKFRAEIAEAEAWFAQVKADEIAWIKAGKDVDAEYQAKYYADPAITPDYSDDPLNWRTWLLPTAGVLAVLITAIILWRRIRRPTPAPTA